MLLRRSGRTVEELARALDLTDNGVRAHLAVLERDGIARQRGSVRRGSGGGKPAYVYELTSEAEELFRRLTNRRSAGSWIFWPSDLGLRSRRCY